MIKKGVYLLTLRHSVSVFPIQLLLGPVCTRRPVSIYHIISLFICRHT